MGQHQGLIKPDAKRILTEAIANDTRFLAEQSIMDYSLLLGIDRGKFELVVGLVDAIGSFNLFKTLESRGKQVLARGGEVTVVSIVYEDRAAS
jgi:1-phosphatidylinositol-3-phosphate 5-kinase